MLLLSSKTIAVHVKKIGSEVENKPSQTLLTLRALERLGGGGSAAGWGVQAGGDGSPSPDRMQSWQSLQTPLGDLEGLQFLAVLTKLI